MICKDNNHMKRITGLFLFTLLFLGSLFSPATAAIVISGPGQQTIPLAIAPPLLQAGTTTTTIGSAFGETLHKDLLMSGIFTLADSRSFLSDAARPGLSSAAVDFAQWRILAVDALVKSSYSVSGNELIFDARLYDVPSGSLLDGRRYRGRPGDERQMAHAFADQILKVLGGAEGAFAGRILFVGKKGDVKELYMMDTDGRNLLPLTAHRSLVLNPDISSTSREVVFTSYRAGRPELYRKEIYSGSEVKLSNRKGVNIGARFHPDGKSFVASLSFEGNAELYLLGSDGSMRKRLTNNWAIDIDPSWSPDGKQIVFTSDRLGTPQLFILDLNSGATRRLAYNGKYDTSPAWSPDGEEIAFARLEEGRFEIYSIRPDGSNERRLTTAGGNKEHPRWSPDGRFLVYSSDSGGKGIWAMRADGSAPRRISPSGLEATHPAWSIRW
jgi:TolB protein